jgi:hypothetical protein
MLKKCESFSGNHAGKTDGSILLNSRHWPQGELMMWVMEDKIRDLEIILELARADIEDRRRCCCSPEDEQEIEELSALLARMRPMVLAAPGWLQTCRKLLDILNEEQPGIVCQEIITPAREKILKLMADTDISNDGSSIAERVAKVEVIFREHYSNADPEADVTDILADLSHYCSAHGLEFKELDRRGYGHFFIERQDESGKGEL